MHTNDMNNIIIGLVFDHFHKFRSGNLNVFEVPNKSQDEVMAEISLIVLEVTDCSSREMIEQVINDLFYIEELSDGVLVRAL